MRQHEQALLFLKKAASDHRQASAIHSTVSVVSARKRAATATFAGSPWAGLSNPPPPTSQLQFLRDEPKTTGNDGQEFFNHE